MKRLQLFILLSSFLPGAGPCLSSFAAREEPGAEIIQAPEPNLNTEYIEDIEDMGVEKELIVPPAASTTPQDETIFEVVDEAPQFPGGDSALNKWLSSEVRYPVRAMENGISGQVIIKFVVEKDGRITHPEIIKHVDKDLDREALRALKWMPKWIPAKNNGETVRAYHILPVNFNLL